MVIDAIMKLTFTSSWLTSDVKKVMRENNKAFNKLKSERMASGLKGYKECNRYFKRAIKVPKLRYWRVVASESKRNPKIFCKYIKGKR